MYCLLLYYNYQYVWKIKLHWWIKVARSLSKWTFRKALCEKANGSAVWNSFGHWKWWVRFTLRVILQEIEALIIPHWLKIRHSPVSTSCAMSLWCHSKQNRDCLYFESRSRSNSDHVLGANLENIMIFTAPGFWEPSWGTIGFWETCMITFKAIYEMYFSEICWFCYQNLLQYFIIILHADDMG